MPSIELESQGARSTSHGSSLPTSSVALIASADEWSVRALQSVLEPKGYRVEHATSGADTLERAEATRPDVIWIWLAHGGSDPAELCSRLRQEAQVPPSTPILIAGLAPVVRAQRLAGLRAGAWDVLTFPFDAEEVLLKLESYVAAKRDADRARERSLLDVDSGLYGAFAMERRAQELVADAARRHVPLACVVLDAEPPPPERGERGARPLKAAMFADRVAPLLHAHGRLSDTIGRWSQAEFAVLAPATDAAGAAKLAARLAEIIEGAPVGASGGPRLEVRAGYDVVDSFEADIPSPHDLLMHASAALDAARAERQLPPFQRYRPESSARAG
jgi:PleD family two-component response regulator